MKNFKNPFAFDENNNLIYMETGNEAMKELYKKCHCPICNEILIPKMGKKNVWHFSHKGNSNCVGGFETSLHLYGKETIKNNTQIYLPTINLGEALEMQMFEQPLKDEIIKWVHINDLEVLYTTIFDENDYNYHWVESETRYDNFIPDSLIDIKGKPVAIEIYVTHKVDDVKRNKVESSNLDMLEIYLNPKEIDKKLQDNNFNLGKYILFEAERKWIYKSSSKFFDEKIKNIIYNSEKALYNEEYSSIEAIQRRNYFLRCPVCRKKLIEKTGKNGSFYACSGFPQCRFTKNNLYDIGCPECGKKLHIVDGRYGKYLSHIWYDYEPFQCSFTRSLNSIEKFLIN